MYASGAHAGSASHRRTRATSGDRAMRHPSAAAAGHSRRAATTTHGGHGHGAGPCEDGAESRRLRELLERTQRDELEAKRAAAANRQALELAQRLEAELAQRMRDEGVKQFAPEGPGVHVHVHCRTKRQVPRTALHDVLVAVAELHGAEAAERVRCAALDLRDARYAPPPGVDGTGQAAASRALCITPLSEPLQCDRP